MIIMTAKSDEYGIVLLERTADGKNANITGHGFEFYIANAPPQYATGIYEQIDFKASSFKGAYNPREILGATPRTKTTESSSKKQTPKSE